MNDKIKFKELITALCELHDKKLSQTLADIYWESLKQFTDEQCIKVFKELILTSRFFPKPVDFIEILNGKKQDQATIAWIEVLGAVKSIGNYQSVKFSNPAIHSVINAMGGWPQLCLMESKEEKWKQKEFERLYDVINSRDGKHPEYLPGTHEMENFRMGNELEREIIKIGLDGRNKKLLN
jgi:hypothetical protein